MTEHVEELIHQCIDKLARGASVEELLLAHPEAAVMIEPALRSAQVLLSLPHREPSASARSAALGRMLNELSAAPSVSAGRIQWFAPFLQKSRAFQAAAVAASVVLVGVAGLSAAAATGAAPEPFRGFFGQSSSTVRVELEGIIVSVEPSENTLQVSAGGAIRTVIVGPSTELSHGGQPITLADLEAGDLVELEGTLQADDTILASRVHLEVDADDPTATPEPSPVDPVLPVPTVDEGREPDDDDNEGDDDDDNSGPGDGGDDDDDGPGSGGDDDDDGDNSGPGSGGEDDDDGPGSGGDDDDDGDNSGPGSGDDNDGDGGRSGSGGGDDDDDNSGPGSGGDDD